MLNDLIYFLFFYLTRYFLFVIVGCRFRFFIFIHLMCTTVALVARVTEISQDGFVVAIERQRKGLCSGARLDVYFPGFPTLKHLKYTVNSAAVYLLFYCKINRY